MCCGFDPASFDAFVFLPVLALYWVRTAGTWGYVCLEQQQQDPCAGFFFLCLITVLLFDPDRYFLSSERAFFLGCEGECLLRAASAGSLVFPLSQVFSDLAFLLALCRFR